MDINEQIKVFRKNGKSHDYIMGYLDGTFEVLKIQREELFKEINKNLNEHKAIGQCICPEDGEIVSDEDCVNCRIPCDDEIEKRMNKNDSN